MSRPQKFRIKKAGTNSKELPVGTIVYDLVKHDYGLASADSRITGIEHISVTLDPGGGYPSFTIVRADLEPVDD